jgi:hypothetical protein
MSVGLMLSVCNSTVAAPGEVVGKYICTIADDRFLFGELGRNPVGEPAGNPAPRPEDPVYYITISRITLDDWISSRCSDAASFYANLPQRKLAPDGSLALGPFAWDVNPPIFEDAFTVRCLSALKMLRKTLGKSPQTTRYGTYLTYFLPGLVDNIFFSQVGINGWFLLRSDMSFVSQDTTWNGGVTVQKGTCARVDD